MSSWKKYRPGGRGSIGGFDTIKNTVSSVFNDPKASMRYLEDAGKSPSFSDVGSWTASMAMPAPFLQANKNLSEGQADAERSRANYGEFTDQDLYRTASETVPPRDNPFEARNYDAFQPIYQQRGSPRVYSTDNSFVFPDTEPVRQNTALIPATALPMIASPLDPLGAEVTASTATPGSMTLQTPETVAAQFRLPAARRRSATQVA